MKSEAAKARRRLRRSLKRMERRSTRLRPAKSGAAYRQIWRVVDGAVVSTFKAHPDYLTPRGQERRNARQSLVKRIVGAVMGYAAQTSAVQSRSGASPAADTGGAYGAFPRSGNRAASVGEAQLLAHSLIIGWLA